MRLALADTAAADLTRHFFREFFYLRFLTDTGADSVRRAIIGVVAALLALFILFPQTVIAKYMSLSARPSPDAYTRAVLADQLFTISVAMFIVGMVAALVCQSLFPDETDYRVLAVLPVRRRLVFGTKVLALVLFAGIFVLVTTAVFGLAFAAASGGRWAGRPMLTRILVHTAVTGFAGTFAGAAVMALQGLIAVLFPRSWLRSVSGAAQTAMISSLILSLPAIVRVGGRAGWLQTQPRLLSFAPPAWFLGLEQVLLGSRDPYFLHLGGLAMLGFAAAALVIGGCYLTVYHRFDQLVLRSSRAPWRARLRRHGIRRVPASGARHTAEAAIADFTMATLRRSGLHQVVFCAIAAGGLALAVNSLLGAQAVWSSGGAAPSPRLVATVLTMPLVLLLTGVWSVRSALLLPLDVRANWVFRLTEDAATRRHQLAAVERAVIRLGVIPYVVLAVALQILVLGLADALRAFVLTTLLGLLLTEVVIRNWRRLPFTCTYIPAKRPLVHVYLFVLTTFTVFVNIGSALISASLTRPRVFVILLGTLIAAVAWMRRTRLARWGRTPLEFEDSLPDEVQVIPIYPK